MIPAILLKNIFPWIPEVPVFRHVPRKCSIPILCGGRNHHGDDLWSFPEYEVIRDVTQWEIINKLEALIPVTYQVVGTMHWGTATFYPESYVEKNRISYQGSSKSMANCRTAHSPPRGEKSVARFCSIGPDEGDL